MKVARAYQPDFEKNPLDDWLEFPREEIEETPDYFGDYRDNLISCADKRIRLARWLTWEEQTPEVTKESATGLRYAAKMYASFLKLGINPEQEQTLTIYDLPSVTWNGKGMLEDGRCHPSQWFDAYFLSVITRDTESMNSLADFPIETMKQSATQSGPVSYKLVEVFQAYHHGLESYPSLLNECMGMAVKQGNDWALDIAMGYLETFAALTTDMELDFNEVLAKNLTLQEKYHIRESGPDRAPVKSFLSLQLLGMACMWHDRGNQVTVEADALPRFLVEGTYF
ncbi:immunity 49 family protein [Shewanella sp. WPAGA9]|uniref:immunity 49 family protein n=1 Tax=Shewanella sp. ENK2 TaxID=2775245 RepID=UPI00177DB83F|nr:immunity 49 family protein [Shewanella sp. WPAGA9]